MNGIIADILVIGILVLFLTLGVKKGAARSIVGVFSFLLTLILYFVLRDPLEKMLLELPLTESWIAGMTEEFAARADLSELALLFSATGTTPLLVAQAVASFVIGLLVFVAIFIVAVLLSKVFGGLLIGLMKLPILKTLNGFLGGVIGIGKGIVVCWLLITVMMLPDVGDSVPFLLTGVRTGYVASLLYTSNIFLFIFA